MKADDLHFVESTLGVVGVFVCAVRRVECRYKLKIRISGRSIVELPSELVTPRENA